MITGYIILTGIKHIIAIWAFQALLCCGIHMLHEADIPLPIEFRRWVKMLWLPVVLKVYWEGGRFDQ